MRQARRRLGDRVCRDGSRHDAECVAGAGGRRRTAGRFERGLKARAQVRSGRAARPLPAGRGRCAAGRGTGRRGCTATEVAAAAGSRAVAAGARRAGSGCGGGVRGRPRCPVRRAQLLYELDAVPNDPRFPELWGLNNTGQLVNGVFGTADADIDAPEAWNTTTGSASVAVAVVDSGIAYDHPDLAANIWSNPGEIAGNGVDDDGNRRIDDVRGWDFVDSDNSPRDLTGHGTHVAGTIGARGNNGDGVAGVNWNSSLMPVRACNVDGCATDGGRAGDLLRGWRRRAGRQCEPRWVHLLADAAGRDQRFVGHAVRGIGRQ